MILEGRDLESRRARKGRDCPAGVCVFCGKRVMHVNDGGTACVAGIRQGDGSVRTYMYCDEPPCDGTPTDIDALWACGDCDCDNLADDCHSCGRPRAEVDRIRECRFALVEVGEDFAVPAGARWHGECAHSGRRGMTRWVVLEFVDGFAASAFASRIRDGGGFAAVDDDGDDLMDIADDKSMEAFLGLPERKGTTA